MTKTMKSATGLFAIIAAIALAFAMVGTAWAATGTPASGTITINPPANATGTNTYKIYKVFDATVNSETGAVAYKLLDGVDTAPEGFTAVRGYITDAPASLDEQATALKNYADKQLVDTVTTTGTTAGTSKALDPGYYYIETSTGTAVYVDNGADITINDKNVITVVDKVAGTQYDQGSLDAIAAVGADQPFTAVITKGKGATNVVFTDTMTNMTYNGDLTIDADPSPVAGTDYTVTPAADNAGFTVTFANDYIETVANEGKITLHYTGKITSAALSINPAKNKASITSGNNAENTYEPPEVEVWNATISVIKTDNENEPLPGAKFKLKNSANMYYAGLDDNGAIVWNATGVEVAAVLVDGAYVAKFEGLADGAYTLEESTVPDGYNKAADVPITIAGGDYTADNLAQSKTIVNETGAVLPSTGGMGTTILYIVGGIMIAVAAVFLVGRRRASKNNESEDQM